MDVSVKGEHCVLLVVQLKGVTVGTVLRFLNARLMIKMAAFAAWEVLQLSEMLDILEGNCQIVRPEHVSVHHISICFRCLGLDNFQQDLHDLPNVMQKFTYVQQCFTCGTDITLHYATALYCTCRACAENIILKHK